VQRALAGLGFAEVQDVRVGKMVDVELTVSPPTRPAGGSTRCGARLLCNPVIEDFTVEMLGDGR